jgi:hypothetical protein
LLFFFECSILFPLKSLRFMLTKKDEGRGKSLWCIGRACRQGLVSFLAKEFYGGADKFIFGF